MGRDPRSGCRHRWELRHGRHAPAAFLSARLGRTLENTRPEYNQLSRRTADARRAGWFPRLIDRNRIIHRPLTFTSAEQARAWLRSQYRRDRTEGQSAALYIGVEKAGMVNQLDSWFGELGIPIIAPCGYSSESYAVEIADAVAEEEDNRPAVLLYAGDFDPSGEDIVRDFVKQMRCSSEVVRIALTPEHVDEYDLPPQMGKTIDTRARAFVERYGQLVQVELDALPPDVLRGPYAEAIERYWNSAAFEVALDREQAERTVL